VSQRRSRGPTAARRREAAAPVGRNPRERPEPRISRTAFAAALGAAGLAYAALWTLLYDPRPAAAGDNVIHLLLARALAEGRGLVDLHLPGTPPHTRLPAALPAFYAPVHALTDGSLAALKAEAGLAGLAAVVLAGLWLARRGRGLALAAAWSIALSPLFVVHAGDTFSEAPFLAASLAGLLLFDRSDAGRRGVPLAGALACAVLAAWFRAVGLALVAALGVALLRGGGVPRRRAALAAAAGLAIAAAPWVGPLGSETGYAHELASRYSGGPTRSRLEVLGWHVQWFFGYGPLGGLLLPWTERTGALRFTANVLALVGLALWCGWSLRARRGDAAPAWLAGGFLLVLGWSAPIERLLLPLLPVMLLAVLDLARRAGGRALAAAGLALCLSQAAAAADAARRSADVRARMRAGNELAGLPGPHAQFRRSALWAGRALPAGSILSARKPQVAFHLAGLQSVPWPATDEPRSFARQLASSGADFLIAGPEGRESWKNLAPFHRAYASRLPLVYETGDPWNTVILDLAPLRQPGGLEPGRPSRWPPRTRFPSLRPPTQAATPPRRPIQDAR
jgi:hypothetical protein